MRSVIFLVVFSAIGCGGKPALPSIAEISGTVNLDGQPLADGYMYFKTVETGVIERFDISNGEFKGKAQIGPRRVEIICNRPKMTFIYGKNVEIADNIIDPAFNLESTLTADVTAEGPNRFTFDVKKKQD